MTDVKVGFKGGAKMTAAIEDLAKKLGGAKGVRVGFLENATYPDGKPVAMVAAIQEYGAPAAHIPRRPYFSNMIKKRHAKWGKSVYQILKNTGFDTERTMSLMGQGIKEQLQDEIISTDSPPLSKVTLMLRYLKLKNPGLVVTGKTVGFAAALVANGVEPQGVNTKVLDDTAHMLMSVDFEVVK